MPLLSAIHLFHSIWPLLSSSHTDPSPTHAQLPLHTPPPSPAQNHLTFALYTHVALWGPDKWPRSFRCNGHLQLNNAKMSKSTGNFKTMEQAILEYGADAMRIGLANAGDTMDDANFEHDTANQAILKLYRQVEWAGEVP